MRNGLVFAFRAKLGKKDFFGPKKHVLTFLPGFILQSHGVLWSQSSYFEPNFLNPVSEVHFELQHPGRLAMLEKHQKWPKSAVFGVFPLFMGSNDEKC